MADEDKERLETSEFAELLPHLSLSDLMKTEYFITKWMMLIQSKPNNSLLTCKLCGICLSGGFKNLQSHIEGKKHKLKMSTVKKLYHPDYTYPKHMQNNKTEGVAASNANTAASNAATTSKSTASSVNVKSTEKLVKNPVAAAKANVIKTTAAAAVKKPQNSYKAMVSAFAKADGTKRDAASKCDTKSNESANTSNEISLKSDKATAEEQQKATEVAKKSENLKSDEDKTKVEQKMHKTNEKNDNTNKKPMETENPKSTSVKSKEVANAKPSLSSTKNDKSFENASNENKNNQPTNKSTKAAEKPCLETSKSKTEPEAAKSTKENEKNSNPMSKTLNSETETEKAKDSEATKNIEKKSKTETAKSTKENEKTSNQSNPVSEALGSETEKAKDSEPSKNNEKKSKTETAKSTKENEKTSNQANKLSPEKEQKTSKNIEKKPPEPQAKDSSSEAAEPIKKEEETEIKPKVGTIKVVNIASLMVVNPAAKAAASKKANESIKKESKTIDSVDIKEIKEKEKQPEDKPRSEHTKSDLHLKQPKPPGTEEQESMEKESPATKSSEDDIINLESEESEENDEPSSKRPKLVVNPAAALLERESSANKRKDSETCSNKPSYQKDKIIIPTVHKNQTSKTSSEGKQNEAKTSEEKERDKHKSSNDSAPYFSTKTFSAKAESIKGLLGVEYVIKIMKNRDDTAPRYECGLCELVMDGVAMQNHIMSYNHRLKFCEKHFPSAVRQYRSFLGGLQLEEYLKVMPRILEKLAIAIEKHHGRDLPYECLASRYDLSRPEILMKVYSTRHASEQVGPTFTHVVDSKQVDRYIEERHNWKPPSMCKDNIFDTRLGVGRRNRHENDRHRRDRDRDRNRVTRSRSRSPRRLPQFRSNEESMFAGGMPSNYDTYHTASSFQPHFAMGYNPHLMAPAPGYVEPSTSAMPLDDATHKMMVEDFLRSKGSMHRDREQRERERDRDRERQRSARDHDRHSQRARSPNRYNRRDRSRSQERVHKSISPLRSNDIWQAYRHMVDQKLKQIDNTYNEYRKDPDNHPNYNEEWQKFWKRRKDELIAAGLDHRSYNYQPEWVRFFKVRLEELYALEAENIKVQCRERLCLPMTNEFLKDSKYFVTAVAPSFSVKEKKLAEPETIIIKEEPKVGVVAVLRLLTALEEHLGSLGPKIVDLLSKALQIEKTNAPQLNALMLTVENCTMLETAMEKFKGLLIAGIMEGSKERAVKKVIVQVEELLKLAEEERKHQTSKAMKQESNIKFGNAPHAPQVYAGEDRNLMPKSSVTTIAAAASSNSASLGLANKKELAVKLAAALAAQGKTDYDPQQLQQLIAVYSVIEKKKREAEAAAASTSTNTTKQKALSDSLSELLNLHKNTKSSECSAKNLNVAKSGNTSNCTPEAVSNYVDMMRRANSTNESCKNMQNNNDNNMWGKLSNMNNPNQNFEQGPYNSGFTSQPSNVNTFIPNNVGYPYSYNNMPMGGGGVGFVTENPYAAANNNNAAGFSNMSSFQNMQMSGFVDSSGTAFMPTQSNFNNAMGKNFNNTNKNNQQQQHQNRSNNINIGLNTTNQQVQKQQQQQQKVNQQRGQQGNNQQNRRNQSRR